MNDLRHQPHIYHLFVLPQGGRMESIMSEYTMVCGAAFEDLTQEEMMDYDGGITPTVILSYIGYSLLSGAVSAASAVSVTYIFK